MNEGRYQGTPTVELLLRIEEGDHDAAENLAARYLPRLQLWAKGRVPRHARAHLDTADLVQDVWLSLLKKLQRDKLSDVTHFAAYLRQSLLNRIRDEARRLKVRGNPATMTDSVASDDPSASRELASKERFTSFETALASLAPQERTAVILRFEWEMSYLEISNELGHPSPDAARMAVRRSVLRLASVMSGQ
jgi:RNA polymerase sigma factor (sigma-70 family)